MFKKIMMTAVLALIITFSAQAAMVSFLVIETGLGEDEIQRQHTQQWENYLLDVFFEAGHIVCNAPILRLEKKTMEDLPKEARNDFNEAADGGVEYFIIAQLDYSDGSMNPNEISLRLFTLAPVKKVHEKKYTAKSYKTADDETNDLKKIAGELIPFIKN